jgi:hypothetical protein
MPIADAYREKKIMVQTDQGQVYLHENFSLENNQPAHGFVKITNNVDKRIFWFNFNAISWIGPRE